jgi:hypothetical protein
MKSFQLPTIIALGSAWLAAALSGCSERAEVLPVSATIGHPDVFTLSGTTWAYNSKMSSDEEALLNDWFQQNPDFIGSGELQGDPMIYRSGSKDRLFVWMYPSVDGAGWTRVLYQRGEFTHESGSGTPF